MREVLRAIKDWCTEKFQAKGNYLTEVPEGYVTKEDLEDFQPGGIRFGKDADGNPGIIVTDETGADTVSPFRLRR